MDIVLIILLIYMLAGVYSLFVNKPTFGKVLGKFFFLSGMLFIGGAISLTFSHSGPAIGNPFGVFLLGLSLFLSFKW